MSWVVVVAVLCLVVAGFRYASTTQESSQPGWGSEPLPNETFNGFSYVQQTNASIIVRVGKEMNMPPRAWLVAVMTAMQECSLHNCANNNPGYPGVSRVSQGLPHQGLSKDHDSVGLFQQRPSNHGGEGGWGPVEELMQPEISSRKFYSKLQGVSGWEGMELTVAAQRVQNSGFPNAYAKHKDRATLLVEHVQKYKPA